MDEKDTRKEQQKKVKRKVRPAADDLTGALDRTFLS